MRLGVGLPSTLDRPGDVAAAAERAGLDLVAVCDDGALRGAPIPRAGMVAASTRTIRVLVVVRLGIDHPVEIAEELAVLDRLSQGRVIVLASADPSSGPEGFVEALDLMRRCWTARPFEHAGPRWRVPARLDANRTDGGLLRVTPAPSQFELPVWVEAAALDVHRHGLPVVPVLPADPPVGPDPTVAPGFGPAPAWVDLPAPTPGWERALVHRLRAHRRVVPLDVGIIRTGADPTPVLGALAGPVRAALQLERLPEGLVPTWGLGSDLEP